MATIKRKPLKTSPWWEHAYCDDDDTELMCVVYGKPIRPGFFEHQCPTCHHSVFLEHQYPRIVSHGEQPK